MFRHDKTLPQKIFKDTPAYETPCAYSSENGERSDPNRLNQKGQAPAVELLLRNQNHRENCDWVLVVDAAKVAKMKQLHFLLI